MSAAYDWMDYSERMLRDEIAKIPDGEYGPIVGWLDDDARNRGVRLRVETKVIVEGDEITIDLTGSNPEVPTGFNVPFEGSLLVGAYYAVRTILLDEVTFPEHVPQNDGVFRPVQGDRAQGDDLQPDLPARVLLALLPGAARRRQHDPRARRRPAREGHRRQLGRHPLLRVLRASTSRAGEYWLYLEVNEGSYGGRYGKDAMDSVDNLMANTRNNPIEELDMRFPMRCDQYELRPEPAAPGQVARRDRDHPAQPLPRRRHRTRARATARPTRRAAIFGGWDGLVASCRKNPDTEREEELPAKVTGIPFAARASSSSSASRTRPATATRSSATRRSCARTCSTTSPRRARPRRLRRRLRRRANARDRRGRDRAACAPSYGRARAARR